MCISSTSLYTYEYSEDTSTKRSTFYAGSAVMPRVIIFYGTFQFGMRRLFFKLTIVCAVAVFY